VVSSPVSFVDHVLRIWRCDFMTFAQKQSETLIDHATRLFRITPEDLEWVGFYDELLLKFEQQPEIDLAHAPMGLPST
jgi:hypothetical protein